MKNAFEELMFLVHKYLLGDYAETQFQLEYMRVWKQYRDTDEIYNINQVSDNGVDRIFTALDSFNDNNLCRNPHELDEEQLRSEIDKILVDLIKW